jgi:HlyD family secretion protein
VAAVGREDIQAKVSANGKVQAKKKVDISATIPGQVTLLAVKEGERVRKGQLLLQIDAVNPRAAARSNEFSMEALLHDQQSADANLAQARSDLARAETNFAAHIIPEADIQRARTAVDTAEAAAQAASRRVEQARAMVEGARDTLAKTTVRAPMDGVITAKRIEEGEVAVIGIQNSPGTVLLTISDMSVVETELEVDETSVPSVKVGQESRVRIDAYPNQTFKGIVTEVGGSPILPAAGAASTAIKFKVKVQIQDPPADVKPGLSVQADILTGFRAKALVVPIQALVIRDRERKPGDAADGTPRDEEGVFLNDGGKARFQAIKTGLLGELSLEVVSGLKGGETLITGPFKALRTLKPGDAVKVEEKKKGAGPKPS